MDTKEIIETWIDQGYGENCFWEAWPECPTPEDELTPKMVSAELTALRAENEKLRKALERIRNVYGGMPYEIAKESLK